MNIDPLKHLWLKHKDNISELRNIVVGEKYTAVLLNNGNIGVCANLNNKITNNSKNFNIDKIEDRIIINAFLNASLNYNQSYSEIIDIFDKINFHTYNNIVMIGYFESLISKFTKNSIKLNVFDKMVNNNTISPIKQMQNSINKCDALILTATTLFNKSFAEIISNTNNKCNIFILGPSGILNPEIFNYCNNIKVIFGSVFNKFDNEVLQTIADGGGTKSFLSRLNKVYITNPTFNVE